ncbi:MAG: LysM peptidoglycan-binding domain-containing protein [Caldilineaceae bacterium SB0662_bin_9]|uniref:LysM peptidoglycan-binding domain-containing protein n=1 Tax=Caldilineaceae bacterium SB0662_bin_9 TaxID=2605258 RepID=A0A6B1DVC5_9CHLR|nr:LysM peptidoglycan-binding domain-containing protein [Caldilineaceae bacterium SB0662_bin_9]
MQVTCFYCGAEAVVTPEYPECRQCTGDLSSLITSDLKAAYYYEKARDAAEQGAHFIALQLIQRGLQAQDTSELHLLAAILYADLDREEQLRAHIGAIPVNDVLRPEAEALLKRLVQRRTGSLAQELDSNSGPQEAALADGSFWGWGVRNATVGAILVSVAAIAILVVLQNPVGNLQASVPDWLTQRAGPAPLVQTEVPASETELLLAAAGDSAQSEQSADSAASEEVVQAPEPATQAAVESVQANGSESGDAWSQQVALNVLERIALKRIDFGPVLGQLGYPELEEREIVAVVQGDQLVLMGTVESLAERATLLDAVSGIPGLGEVDAEALNVVVPSQTHIVVSGDSLWNLAYRYLGDGNLWPEIVAANPNSEDGLLVIGQEIQIPERQIPVGS